MMLWLLAAAASATPPAECPLYNAFYCLEAQAAKAPANYDPVTVEAFGSDSQGRAVTCKGVDNPPDAPAEPSCAFITAMIRFRPDQAESVRVYKAMIFWSARNLATYAGTTPPARPATLIKDGYGPLKPGDDSACRDLTCRWTYPRAALRDGRQGRAIVSLGVSAEGKVKECRPLIAGDPELDWITCARFLDWVRFAPALDAVGKPRSSVLTVAMPYTLAAR